MMVQSSTPEADTKVYYAVIASRLYIRAVGRLSVTSCGAFFDALSTLIREQKITWACIDFKACKYLDSTLMGNLVGLHKLLAGKLFIHEISADARQSLQVMGILRLIKPCEATEIFPETPELLQSQKPLKPVDLLNAHDLLSSLNPENAQRFAGLRSVLQAEINRKPE